MVSKLYDGSSWKNINGLKLFDGSSWKNTVRGWAWDGSAWKQWYPEYPINTAAPTVSGSTIQGQTLSVTNGSWNSNLAYTPTSYTYQWKRSGSNISGATSSTYTTVVSDVGNSITCMVTAVNNRGTTPVNSSNGINIVSATYTLTYNGNGGTVLGNSSTSTTVNVGSSVTLPSATRSYYSFSGWYTASSGGTYLGTTGGSYTPPSDITIYAQWSAISYTVSFNANGGSVSPTSASGTNSGGVVLPTPSRTNYSFLGWYTASSGGSYVGGGGSAYYPTSNTTLYAQWQIITYTVSWNANGGSVSPTSSSVNAGSSVTAPTPTRSGYTFNGWYNASSGGSLIVNAGNSYTPSSSVTLYAQWSVTPIIPSINSLSISTSDTAQTLITVNWSATNQSSWSISASPATGGASGGSSFSGTSQTSKYVGVGTAGTTYTFTLTITSSTGNTASQSVNHTPPSAGTAPSTPTNLTNTYASGPSWTGTWSASSGTTPITYYWTLYQANSNGGAVTNSASGSTTSTTFTQSMNSTYGLWAYFTVYAQNSVGTSGTATSGWA